MGRKKFVRNVRTLYDHRTSKDQTLAEFLGFSVNKTRAKRKFKVEKNYYDKMPGRLAIEIKAYTKHQCVKT